MPANGTDPVAVAKTLRNTSVDTVVGAVIFDDKSDVKIPRYDINVWKEGKYSKLTQ